MNKILIILVFTLTISLSYSQQNKNKPNKYSIKILDKAPKDNIWVMDVMKSYTGQGSTGWDFDYTEIVKARNLHGLPTLIETSEKIEGTESWRSLYHAELSYFNNDTISEYKLNEWNISNNNWVNDFSYYETKDDAGKILIHYTRSWDNESQTFIQGNKEIYTYNLDNFKTIKEDKDWNNNTWEDYQKTFYYYDDNNNDTLELQKRFISSGNWRDNWKTKFIYDLNNRKISEQQWGYDSYWDEWFNYSKTTIFYYENGLIKEEYTEKYDYDNSEWYDLARTKYYYLADGLLDYKEDLDLQNDGNNLKYVYTYNENNKETSFFLYDWNGTDWILFYKVFDNYDANENQTDYYSQVSDGTWQNYLKEEYTWNEFYVNIEELSQSEIKIFPNPVSKKLTIKNNFSEEYLIKIYDLTGKKIFETKNKQNIYKIDVSKYPKGIYFVKLFKNNKNISFKFLKK